jgi:hypothetical protein
MSTPKQPIVFTHVDHPEWGHAIVLEDLSDRWRLFFEHGGAKVFLKKGTSPLKRVELGAEEAVAVDDRLRGRATKKHASAKTKAKKPSSTKAAPSFASFDEQVAWFEKKFPGGFPGQVFVLEERGEPGVKGKKGYKEAAIALARERLSPERFASADVDALFASAKALVGATTIAFPQEGAIPFGAVAPETRPGLIAALGELLHGAEDYGVRLDRFVRSLDLRNAEGGPKPVTWPLATLLPALYAPNEHVCVKPTYFSWQANLVGRDVEKSQPVTAAGYTAFREVALLTRERLLERGNQPRDLMDVYSFIWRSHAEKKV